MKYQHSLPRSSHPVRGPNRRARGSHFSLQSDLSPELAVLVCDCLLGSAEYFKGTGEPERDLITSLSPLGGVFVFLRM